MKFLNLSKFSIKVSSIVFVDWSDADTVVAIVIRGSKKSKLKRLLLQKENESDQIYENDVWRLRQILDK